jgi:uncharacterized protein (TIGR02145 family)
MKKKFTLILVAAAVCSGYAQKTPPHAASTRTWTFDALTWSDAIHFRKCNKKTFKESNTEPQCRSYISRNNTWYYYNWPYVMANAARLCPYPWRVPGVRDFNSLLINTTHATLVSQWGYGGDATDATGDATEAGCPNANYWSSTEHDDENAYYLEYNCSNAYAQNVNDKNYGFQVRCVK